MRSGFADVVFDFGPGRLSCVALDFGAVAAPFLLVSMLVVTVLAACLLETHFALETKTFAFATSLPDVVFLALGDANGALNFSEDVDLVVLGVETSDFVCFLWKKKKNR